MNLYGHICYKSDDPGCIDLILTNNAKCFQRRKLPGSKALERATIAYRKFQKYTTI